MSTGASFLFASPADVFTCEDFTGEHRQIARTALDFVRQEVLPVSDRIERKDWPLTRQLVRRAGELGLLAAGVPEHYGGLELDQVSSVVLGDCLSLQASFSVTVGGQTGIGLLPIVYFGTEEQRRRCLPRLASGEWIGAYALSESSSGSDALNARTRATLAADGRHYLLNGEKMWITNASLADLFIVFAKVDSERFTAFLVERSAPGLAIGAEEHKLGIRGSSTCPLILTDCPVPAANLLGEVGAGHRIALNILNLGRLKLAAACVGQARAAFDSALRYAAERRAFGRPIASYGLIRQKLARMGARLFASESMVYRTAALIDAAQAAQSSPRALEEFAVECAIAKVAASEMLDLVVDEAVQIHGGYGFVEEYAAERAFRDARVNRIFEGTNEINRLLVAAQLAKRAEAGRLALDAAPASECMSTGDIALARSCTLAAFRAARAHYGGGLAQEQEAAGAVADLTIALFGIESAWLRARKHPEAEPAAALAAFDAAEMLANMLEPARLLAIECPDGALAAAIEVLHRHLLRPPSRAALGQRLAAALLAAGRYPLGPR